MPDSKKALIVGATGLIGNLCLQQLLNDNEFIQVEAWVRKPLNISNAKFKCVEIEFGNIAQIPSTNATHIFCCLGTTIKIAGSQDAFRKVDFEYVYFMAKLAERSHSEKFLVISSIGANANSGNFYLRVKGEMEESIKILSIPSIVIIRPSMLLGKRQESRTGEVIGKVMMRAFNFLLTGRLKKYRAIEASKVANAMVVSAKQESKGLFVLESDQILQKVSG